MVLWEFNGDVDCVICRVFKVHQKLDLMGIGANRRGHDGDDAGWRGGREFEGLLARLNQAQNADTQEIPVDEEHVPDDNDSAIDTEHKKQKRKRCTVPEDDVDEKEAKRRRKEEKREKKEQKKAKKAAKKLQNSNGEHGDQTQMVAADDFREQDAEAVKATPRYRAYVFFSFVGFQLFISN